MSKFTEYIGSQFGNPTGLIGKICCMLMNRMNHAMYDKTAAAVITDKQSVLLDIGYGNGYLVQKLLRKNCDKIYGIDISEDMKRTAEKRNQKAVAAGKADFSVGDCCMLNFQDESFDAVTSVNTIYFWEDTVKGLSEIHRVCKPNGVFCNAVYAKEWLNKLSYTQKGFRLFEKEDYIAMGKAAGFQSVSIENIADQKSYLICFHK